MCDVSLHFFSLSQVVVSGKVPGGGWGGGEGGVL